MSKVWFVTGSSRGLGRCFVEAALSRGDRVAATARTTASLDDLVAEHGDAVLPPAVDVTDGYAQIGAIEELAEREVRDRLEANVFGALWVVRAVLPHLRARGSGHIVQLSARTPTRSPTATCPRPTRPTRACASAWQDLSAAAHGDLAQAER
ncbi:SDR family NAD(P)-dependent oxidoreductase [Saccharothrix sp. NPDC042600]|uniref:SDR family NAD(P)-dependent oxidoreductase n=1 Tax=Saccharothrix TaxID=2071 RepID=UPI00340E303A|nr:hypothetical protein GCM10017745_43000 [Saccharothrix mutabilis subsp. capreolus]